MLIRKEHEEKAFVFQDEKGNKINKEMLVSDLEAGYVFKLDNNESVYILAKVDNDYIGYSILNVETYLYTIELSWVEE